MSRHRRRQRHRDPKYDGAVAMIVYLGLLLLLCAGAVVLGTQAGWWEP